MDQDETWHEGRSRPWPHCVRWGLRSPKTSILILSRASVFIRFSRFRLYIELCNTPVTLSNFSIVLYCKKGVQAPHFSAHVCCGQTARWIKMPLGKEVGFDQATLCSMGTQLPPKK